MSSSALLDVFEDASRARSGILTPTSEGSLNRPHGASSPGGDARKSGLVVAMEQLLKPSIAVKVNLARLFAAVELLLTFFCPCVSRIHLIYTSHPASYTR